MHKRSIWAVIALGSLLAVPALAGASSSGTSHQVKLTGLRDGLWSNSSVAGVGLPGTEYIVTGTASGTIGGNATGEGTFYENAKWLSFVEAKGTGALLMPNGSISYKGLAKNAPASYTETATVTGGTGAYRHASGTLKISGKSAHMPGDKDVSTNNVTGTLNY